MGNLKLRENADLTLLFGAEGQIDILKVHKIALVKSA